MVRITNDTKIDMEALVTMGERGGKWAVYQNMALDSADLGGLRFLQVGEGCTFKKAPERYPDTHGIGWRYLHCGFVDLNTGLIVDEVVK